MIRRKKEDVLKDLPDKSHATVPLPLDNWEEYKHARDDFMSYLKGIDEEKAKRAERAQTLAQINKLIQLSVQGKMNYAVDWISDFLDNDQKLVVFTHLRETADALMKKFGKRAVKVVGGMSGKERSNAEHKFQNDKNIRLFVGNHKAAGEGLTLTAASNVGILELPWTPSALNQCIDRVHRISQDLPVTAWFLIGSHTIEEDILSLIREKAKVTGQVIDGEAEGEEEKAKMFDELIKTLKKGRRN
jgi:SWI/SNF-related matrix-associated actin-dependent regulator 1 of chromatin subfamily A